MQSYMYIVHDCDKSMQYRPSFSDRNGFFCLGKKKRMPSERASQEEQNDAKFSFVAPSSDELSVRKETKSMVFRNGLRQKKDAIGRVK